MGFLNDIFKAGYKKILSRVVVASLLMVSFAVAQTIDSAQDSTVTSGGDENITITDNGSITTDDNDINITDTLQSDYTLSNDGNLTSNSHVAVFLDGDNNGTIQNRGIIDSNESSIIVNGHNNGNIFNYHDIISNNGTAIDIVGDNNGQIYNNNMIFSGTDKGIYLRTNYGQILNDTRGQIYANIGIKVDVNDFNKSIWNKGNISSNGSSIRVDTNNGDIINQGIVESNSYGIEITSDNNGLIINSQSTVGTSSSGIYSTDSSIYIQGSNNGSILNYTSLSSMSGSSIEIARNNNGVIKNYGSISSGYSNVIEIAGNNTGVIENYGNISPDGARNVILIGDDNDGNITNFGTLTNSRGEGIDIQNNNNGSITNGSSGVINTAESSIVSRNNDGNITNIGTLTSSRGNGIKIAGDNNGTILNDTNGNISSVQSSIFVLENNSGNITNRGTLAGSTEGGIEIAGDNNGTILNDTDGNITINYSAILIGGETAGTIINNGILNAKYSLEAPSATSGTFTNNGTAIGSIHTAGVDVYNNGTIKLNPTDKIESKSYTQGANGVFAMGVSLDDDNLTNQSSTIYTSGNIVFENGSTIDIDFTNTNETTINKWYDTLSDSKVENYKNLKDTQGLIATTSNGVIEADIETLKFVDNSVLLDFYVDDNGTDMNLLVKKAGNGLEKLADAQLYPYEASVARALDSIFANSDIDSDIDAFLTALDAKETDEQKAETLVEATPVATVSSAQVTFQAGNIISGIIGSRQSSSRGLNSGDKVFTDRNFWIRPYASYASQDNVDNNKGFSSHTKGFVMGVDGQYSNAKRFGLAFSYGSSSVDTNDIDQTSDINSFSLTAYGSRPIVDSKTNFSYQIGMGIQRVSSDRYISAISKTASASYNSKLYYAQAVVNRSFKIRDGISFTPMIKLRYRLFRNPSYSESGAGGMDLNAQSYSSTEMLLGTGGTFVYTMNQATNVVAFANINYDFSNDAQTVSSSFQGASDIVFETTGIKESPYSFSTGLSVNRKLLNNSSFSFGASLDKKSSGFTNCGVFAKYNMKF
jgi:outer membrane autotransporter protein